MATEKTYVGFNDSGWLQGATGIGYGDGDDATVLSDMRNSYKTVYGRKTFNVSDAASVTGMTLDMDYDDGFVAYINGVEVARANMPAGMPDYDTSAGSHEAGTPVGFDLGSYMGNLVTGTNVLSVEVHNQSLTSSDVSMIPELEIENTTGGGPVDTTPPTVTISSPTAATTYTASSSNFEIGGTSSDDTGVAQVTWSNDRGGSGTAIGTTSWSAGGIVLQSGDNVITVTASDASNNTGTDILTVVYTPSGTTSTVINIGDTWRYFKGYSNPGSGWNDVGFNDSGWLQGATGIGYGDGDDATVLSDMRNSYKTVYGRKTFNISNASSVTGMTLDMDWDDGFVAYINGVEVARANMPAGMPDYDTSAGSHEAGAPVGFDLGSYMGNLVTGTNVLSIEGHNVSMGSSDFSMIPELRIVNTTGGGPIDTTPPTVTILSPTAATTYTASSSNFEIGGTSSDDTGVAQVTWSNDRGGSGTAIGTTSWSAGGIVLQSGDNVITVTARDASNNTGTDILTVVYTPSGTTSTVINIGDTWNYFKGYSNPGSGWNDVGFNDSGWLQGATGIGYGDGDDATVLSDMRNSYKTVYGRKTFNISNASSVTGMTLDMDWDDGFVAYINGVEVARANMPAGMPDYDTSAGSHEAGTPVGFDLGSYMGNLVTGTNVLSIEGHNVSMGSSDFSMIPELMIESQ